MIEDILRLKAEETNRQLLEVQDRLRQINHGKNSLKSKENNVKKDNTLFDWTKSYENWADWAKEEELRDLQAREEKKLDALFNQQNALGHVHDHSKEREFFQLPEAEKMNICEGKRLLGNYLFKEGNFRKAAEQYHLAISYYEYCFPEKESDQKLLDDLRHVCLCNMSLCFIRIGEYRKAIESASHVLKETNNLSAKAFFRRGQAYRLLDEYENALDDLRAAKSLAGDDMLIVKELDTLEKLWAAYNVNSSAFAKAAIQEEITTTLSKLQGETSDTTPQSLFNLNMPLELMNVGIRYSNA